MGKKDKQTMPKTQKEWTGCVVRSKKEMRNGNATFKEGSLFVVDGKWGGLSMRSVPCPTCGIRVSITKVDPSDVEVLSELPSEKEGELSEERLRLKKEFSGLAVRMEEIYGQFIKNELRSGHVVKDDALKTSLKSLFKNVYSLSKGETVKLIAETYGVSEMIVERALSRLASEREGEI